MFKNRKALPSETPEQQESVGLHLKIRLSEEREIDLKVSERALPTLAPWLSALFVLSLGGAGLWLWFSYIPRQITASSPTAEIQPRK